jgi:hypothetical protein
MLGMYKENEVSRGLGEKKIIIHDLKLTEKLAAADVPENRYRRTYTFIIWYMPSLLSLYMKSKASSEQRDMTISWYPKNLCGNDVNTME